MVPNLSLSRTNHLLLGKLSKNLLRRHLNHHFKEFVSSVSLELLSSSRSKCNTVSNLSDALGPECNRSIRHRDQSTEVHLSVNNFSLSSNRCFTVSVKCRKECTFTVHTCQGRLVVQSSNVFNSSLVVISTLNSNSSLSNSRKHLIPVQYGSGASLHIHTLQSSNCQKSSINLSIVQLTKTGLNITTEIHTCPGRVLSHELCLTTKGSSSNHSVIGQIIKTFNFIRSRDECIIGILTLKGTGENGSIRNPGRNILHGVHANINFIAEKSNIKFLGEESLTSQFHE
mmetsp:Transcript_1600/g.2434  ORF Transcript_1600/g.2434 Transcript_1600/m.2434 type:complete len:285 (-) Transcript_1600:353-1207(-)